MAKITIHRHRNTSRSSMPHPYARSATERNFSENASSRKPSITLMLFIQFPLLGALFSIVGKRAKSVKGSASAMAKPSMPIVGARMEPLVPTSTSRKPMMGPVHEKLTSVSVNAIRNMLSRPVVFSAFESTALLHDEGSVSSKPPRKLSPKSTSSRKKNMLKMALVLMAFSALAPKNRVTSMPRPT